MIRPGSFYDWTFEFTGDWLPTLLPKLSIIGCLRSLGRGCDWGVWLQSQDPWFFLLVLDMAGSQAKALACSHTTSSSLTFLSRCSPTTKALPFSRESRLNAGYEACFKNARKRRALLSLPSPQTPSLAKPSCRQAMDIEMDQEVVWSRKCPCGKSFYQPNSYSNHVKTCPRFKGEVGNTLEAAKARYAQKKKSKKGKEAIESWYGDEDLDLDLDVAAGDPMRDIEVRRVPLCSATERW